MNFWARLKARIAENRYTIIALASIIVAFLFLPSEDYRWVGHSIIGITAAALLVTTVIHGAALARRIRRPPNRNRFHLHRKCGFAMALLMVAALSYGFWIFIADHIRLSFLHLLATLLILIISAVMVATGLSRRRLTKPVHRWVGYLGAAVIILQLASGVLLSPLFKNTGKYPSYTITWETSLDKPWQPDGIISPGEYAGMRVLNEGNFEISYRADGQYVYLGLNVKTTGWVGIGIAAGRGMKNADIVIASVTDNGAVTVEDRFGVSRAQPVADAELGGTNDIIEYGGKEAGGFTTIEFKRPIVPGDKFDIPLVQGKQTIIWAYGSDDSPGMHTADGYINVYLSPPATTKAAPRLSFLP